MNTELQMTPLVNDIELTATLPIEMINSQQQLITWCDGKINLVKQESSELLSAFEHAKKMKWKFSILQNQYNGSLKRISYYEKIKAALLAGYYIIPNFDVEIFAIRTDKGKPKRYLSTSSWDRERDEQPAHDVPITVGDYVNNRPEVYQRTIDEKTKQYWAENWKEVEFPVNMAKPMIMEATTEAMALKIFDRFGVFPSTRKKVDPVIIGQIVNRVSKYNEKIVSFMIAWHLDTRVL